MNRLQLRVLYRQFLFRIVDLEVLSPQAQGDANRLLGQFATLLVFVSAALTVVALLSGSARGFNLILIMVVQHFLIATTMLVVGLFAVLSWDSTFPDRRDVMVLAPLPVPNRTMFTAKVAAVGTALGLTILLLHGAMGLVWPLTFAAQAKPSTLPTLAFDPTPSPVPASELEAVMNRDLRQALTSGVLAPGTGSGLAIGVVQRGERRVFTYGVARADSLFEIGSITKTFTGLMLARMAAEGKVRLDEPVRELLPPGTVGKPPRREITLLDLVTHRSGLPAMPYNFHPADRENPYADYGPNELYGFIGRRGVSRPDDVPYRYSNLGMGLLGQALANRAGKSYPDQLRDEITVPLGMNNTVIRLSPEMQARFLQGHDQAHRPVHAWDLDGLAGAGAIRSTAGDMLTYLEANLNPGKYPALTSAIASSHQVRADAGSGDQIALGWDYNASNGTYNHSGATAGFTAFAFFNPRENYAGVVLLNTGVSFLLSPPVIGQHMRQRLTGYPAISLETVVVPASAGFLGGVRSYAAYWFTMFASGVFVFGAVLALQGVAAQLLPRGWFLRVSGYLQLAAFCVIVCVYFLQPGFGGLDDLSQPSLWRTLHWLPSYWFLGLYEQLNGSMHPALAPLAQRAWIGLTTVVLVSAGSYALAYWRTLRKIVEEPDIVPGTRRLGWLPRFGSQAQTAIVHFSVRTLARSRQHRMILAFYLGIGLAFTSLLLKDPATKRRFADAAAGNPWREASTAVWIASIIMMVLATVGARVVFALPLDLRGNWIFRMIGVRSGPQGLAASRRALLLLSVAPVWLVEAIACYGLWPSRDSAIHLVVLGLLGLILADICLLRFRKIPFACSYLPGKSRFHMIFLGSFGLFLGSVRGVLLEREAVKETGTAALMLGLLVVVWVCVRWTANALAKGEEQDLRFEEREAPAVQGLGLYRDGVMPLEH